MICAAKFLCCHCFVHCFVIWQTLVLVDSYNLKGCPGVKLRPYMVSWYVPGLFSFWKLHVVLDCFWSAVAAVNDKPTVGDGSASIASRCSLLAQHSVYGPLTLENTANYSQLTPLVVRDLQAAGHVHARQHPVRPEQSMHRDRAAIRIFISLIKYNSRSCNHASVGKSDNQCFRALHALIERYPTLIWGVPGSKSWPRLFCKHLLSFLRAGFSNWTQETLLFHFSVDLFKSKTLFSVFDGFCVGDLKYH